MLLIFPPGWTPYSPYLALPQLKGYLKNHKLDADIRDENIIFFDTVLCADYLLPKINVLSKKFKQLDSKAILTPDEEELYRRLTNIELYRTEIAKIEEHKNILRQNRVALSKEQYGKIIRIFSVALDVLNITYDQKIDFTDISFNKYREDNVEQVRRAITDKDNNIFVDYFKQCRSSLIKQSEQYDLIGFSITSAAQLIPALTLIDIIKETNKRSVFFLGGNYITRLTEQRLHNLSFLFKYVDFISIYEGEYTLQALLLSRISKETFYKKINSICNIIYFSDNKLIHTDKKIFDINDVVCPDFTGFDLSLYFSPKVILPLLTSKNCYSHCAFCTIAGGTGGRHYRVVAIDKVHQFMNELSSKYDTNYFTFVDETFHLKRMVELSKLISKEKKDYIWYSETRFDYPLSYEEGRMLYEGGCRKIQFGLESYNQRVLDLMEKNICVQNIRSILENCMKNDISFHLFFIIGFPTETMKEFQNTVNFIDDIIQSATEDYGVIECSKGMSIFGLEKGSKVFDNPQKYGIEIIEDPQNDIGLGYAYNTTIGLHKNEMSALFEDIIKKTYNNRNIVNIPVDRMLGEEASIFFCENVISNEQKKQEHECKCIQVSHNTNSSIKGNWYLYYNFLNNYSLVYSISPKCLSDFDKNLLNAYGLHEDEDQQINAHTMKMKINPYISFTFLDNDSVLVTDSISGDRYELNLFTYEILQTLSEIEYSEMRDYYSTNNLLSLSEFDNLLNMLIKDRIIILYN